MDALTDSTDNSVEAAFCYAVARLIRHCRHAAWDESMGRVVAYLWFTFVLSTTGWLSDLTPILKLRGFLVRWCFRSCGRNLQIAGGVRILFTNRVDLGDDVYMAPGCWLQGVGGIKLGDEVMLGPYTVLATNNHQQREGSYRFGDGVSSPIELGRGSWTGAHVVVTGGVTISDGAAVAAGAVVISDVARDTVVGGVPARPLESRDAAEDGHVSS